ncbi:hypothetical protein OHT76_43125 [Streptomyces sp. NBC_00287]|uniref:hypothetical protein n=1 Tax=Streptomyces sp. NBC_00287 TaxID=2975702 RepID=UPI002E290CA8|nr:hypothetical protein [Streptomyces sp. NBC_00287]
MGLCELAVRPPWQSQGIGTRLHAELLKAVNPRWSSLLAVPSNRRGQNLRGVPEDAVSRFGDEYWAKTTPTPSPPRHNMAHLRGETGDAAGAATAYADLLPHMVRVLGEDHPRTLAAHANLAYWRGEAGGNGAPGSVLTSRWACRARAQLGPTAPVRRRRRVEDMASDLDAAGADTDHAHTPARPAAGVGSGTEVGRIPGPVVGRCGHGGAALAPRYRVGAGVPGDRGRGGAAAGRDALDGVM